MGIVFIPFSHESNYMDIITAVDKALYQAKKEGKNRLIITEIS